MGRLQTGHCYYYYYYVLLSIILQCLVTQSSSFRVLGVFPVMSKSHFAMHNTLMKALAARGHEVTVLSFIKEPFMSELLNYNHIYLGDPTGLPNFVDNVTPEEAKIRSGFLWYLKYLVMSDPQEVDLCVMFYRNEYIKRIRNGRAPIPDLFVTEIYHLPCYNSLAEKLGGLPVIATTAQTDVYGINYLIGNPIPPSYWPNFISGYTQKMDFRQRLINWSQYVLIYIAHYVFYIKLIFRLDERFVGNEDVTLEKLHRRTSMVFFNNHFSFLNRPTVPNAIEIGGIHIREPSTLPSDIQQFIDGSENGVIFFSFGSALKMSSFPKVKIDAFKKAFSAIPQRVLWRSDDVNLTETPTNVMIRNWFPQRDILEHENVKAFISHCGIFSTYEAVHTGTPIIGIPCMHDQFTNANVLREKGVAISLDYETLDDRSLLKALKDIIDEPRYRQNMQAFSTVFKDRPMKPIDSAIYWTEYVVKHGGASNLRVASADMPFYKFLLLDVILIAVIATLVSVYVIYYLFRKTFAGLRQRLFTRTSKKVR